MILGGKNFFRKLLIIIAILAIIAVAVWFLGPAVKKLIWSNEHKEVTAPLTGDNIDKTLKQKIIWQLAKFKQYGEWPISAVRENPQRGNPFAPKQ
ncbi:MAG: hypothetical protein A3B89_03250 [Candidatus Buchananbacteria bacterium RIFCSPHIGHO2_02_FULL_40_13]|uniref:Uncharacterized protein n=1 Tax=Candidatus Buchananbacteria bacterium RIFCSPLOWO2_01_FULL_39_33 TaxID=1797543 RepID=A0A1G1YGF4_9BACT|nr:MAG: hypothetical protein A2820_01495 [Candidatus Buchananbacteria bacterium RIFCSPHIGHO2_01_FULL_40_35]OGY50205.1 MAG: hypothetical protein A3B89_03250 [Candidatus Buchananbacteria bacterium RIFCSPHIGHO2_02_FULL_40_13]OGY51438.1 MAG: hypothetical protein A3A02_04595 [Candidatus Buchananbacteria bacterium RIFCSPLOWO2_01_FULL_39_33]